jgi:hypothetical protein
MCAKESREVKAIMECWDDALQGEVPDCLFRGVFDAMLGKKMPFDARQLHILVPQVDVCGKAVDDAQFVRGF